MPFTARNARYLRISAHTVLPLYIYLDDKHVEWMTDYILQRVLEDLRPVIGPKLHAEQSAKKGTVDVHRGDTYQFAYFFRKNEPHAVLIKTRNFIPSPPSAQTSEAPVVESLQLSKPAGRKRSGATSKSSSAKSARGMRAKQKQKQKTRLSDSDEAEGLEENGATSESAREEPARRTLRKRTLMARGYRELDNGDGDDVVMVDSDYNTDEVEQEATEDAAGNNTPTTAQSIPDDTIFPEPEPRLSPIFDTDTEGEEEKPKLSMRVTYQGFTIYARCLCLIVEPWPRPRGRSRMQSVAPSIARDSVHPTGCRERTPLVSIRRERTPLFLSDLDPRSSTPAPLPSRFLPPVPLFNDNYDTDSDDQEDATDEGGMMAFSQALKSAGDERAGSADEDENEGDVFLGDADERKGNP